MSSYNSVARLWAPVSTRRTPPPASRPRAGTFCSAGSHTPGPRAAAVRNRICRVMQTDSMI